MVQLIVYTAGTTGERSDFHNVLSFTKSSLTLRNLFIYLYTNGIYIQKLFQQIRKELARLTTI